MEQRSGRGVAGVERGGQWDGGQRQGLSERFHGRSSEDLERPVAYSKLSFQSEFKFSIRIEI